MPNVFHKLKRKKPNDGNEYRKRNNGGYIIYKKRKKTKC